MRDKNKSKVKSDLRKTGVRPSKQRGQNFLVDQSFISEIINFARADLNQHIVEIGPGLGALTSEISAAEKLTLIEIEPEFCRQLKEKYPDAEIINKDVRTVNFSEIGKDLFIFGNLPYSYSTEIIFNLIDNREYINSAVILLQQEFAERMAAGPGSRTYGVLSISAQIWCNISLGPVVKGDAFVPSTKVNSRLLSMEFVKKPKYNISDYAFFKKVVRGAFLQRRKKISNSLAAAGFSDKKSIEEALLKSGIDSGRRAETLSIEEFIMLTDNFGS